MKSLLCMSLANKANVALIFSSVPFRNEILAKPLNTQLLQDLLSHGTTLITLIWLSPDLKQKNMAVRSWSRACLCSLCQSFELFRIRTKTFITMWIILTIQMFQMCHPAKNMSKMQNCELAVARGATNGASVHCDSLRLVLRAFESAKINSMAQRQVGINLAELWNPKGFWSVTLSKHVASFRNKMLVKERPFLEAAYSM